MGRKMDLKESGTTTALNSKSMLINQLTLNFNDVNKKQ